MFVDNVNILIKAGRGGAGLVSFHRAKFIPFGGPDGGDGGRGGDVIFRANHDVVDLSMFKHKASFAAEKGKAGGSQKRTGQNGKNLIIEMPVGTMVYAMDDTEETLIADLKKDGQEVIAARGGIGGLGNVQFATATRKAPREAQSGQEGEEYRISLKLRLLIDVAVLGLANSGKSTLLSAISEAKPEIAEYPFTTRVPVLAVVESEKGKCLWAEIPAVSHKGRDSADKATGQLQRAHVIMYLIDACTESVEQDLARLVEEFGLSDDFLSGRKQVVVINKTDLVENLKEIDGVRSRLSESGITSFLISAAGREGLAELVSNVNRMVAEAEKEDDSGAEPARLFKPRLRKEKKN